MVLQELDGKSVAELAWEPSDKGVVPWAGELLQQLTAVGKGELVPSFWTSLHDTAPYLHQLWWWLDLTITCFHCREQYAITLLFAELVFCLFSELSWLIVVLVRTRVFIKSLVGMHRWGLGKGSMTTSVSLFHLAEPALTFGSSASSFSSWLLSNCHMFLPFISPMLVVVFGSPCTKPFQPD